MNQEFQLSIDKTFADDGPLCKHIEGFKRRESQVEFAQAVGEAIENRETAVVEAGTGTGKTFAYLIPAILSGSKTIVSTASKTLQDQLFSKDVNLIQEALGRYVTVTVLKGRANYICKFRLERLIQSGLLPERTSGPKLDKIRQHAKFSTTGDINEVHGISEGDPLWPLVTSTRENCLSNKCPHYEECFLTQARRKALESDVVVVNHHLFLADLSLKDDSMGELLPAADLIILDEAHKLADIGIDYFSDMFSLRELSDFSEDARRVAKAYAASALRWDDEFTILKKAILNFHEAFSFNLHLEPDEEVEIAAIENFAQEIKEPLEELLSVFGQINKYFADLAGHNEELDLVGAQAAELLMRLENWQKIFQSPEVVKTVNGTPSVLWLRYTEQNVIFANTPLTLAESFRKARSTMPCAWVFTSATISTKNDNDQNNFSYFLSELGLDAETKTYSWASPFNYELQGRLYLPKGLPGVFDDDFAEKLVEETWPLIEKTHGRAFFLCTSFRSMDRIAECLRMKAHANYTLCVQGESPKTELLQRFKEADNGILVGSMSFWEGVDMKGDALQLVVIDKLPFAQFDTPVARARKEWLEQQKKNPFVCHQLPEMITTLRQGVGRLIRSENDYGVIVCGDNRLIEKRYGSMVIKSLPPMIRTQDFARVYSFLDNPHEAY